MNVILQDAFATKKNAYCKKSVDVKLLLMCFLIF